LSARWRPQTGANFPVEIGAFDSGSSELSVELAWMPITIFDVKGIPAATREHIEEAVAAARRNLSAPHEAWIAADPLRGALLVRRPAMGLDIMPDRSLSAACDSPLAARPAERLPHRSLT
jgi:hypothetical protein